MQKVPRSRGFWGGVMALLVLNGGAVQVASAQTSADVQLAVLQYRGGGDWYANPTAVPNLSLIHI